MPGAGQWILNDARFKSWEDGSCDPEILWCHGLPGAGKTFITSVVVRHLEDRIKRESIQNEIKSGLAYLYCDFTNQREHTIVGLISSLARQLVESRGHLSPNPLMREANAFYQKFQGRLPGLMDFKQLLKDLVGHLDKTFVVIDALDECAEFDEDGGSNRETLINVLLSLPVRLLVTSRHYSTIEILFKDAKTLEISPDPDDIKSYVHWRIFDRHYGSPMLASLIQDSPSLQDTITETVFDKCSKIFNLARLQMDHIQRCHSVGAVHDALATLRTTQREFYDMSWDRIEKSRGYGEQYHLGFRVLAWILRAKRPLKVDEIQDALAVRPDRYSASEHPLYKTAEHVLVDACAGLVIIEPGSRNMTFAHPTIREYLDDVCSSGKFPFDVEVELARTCLTYLSYDVFCEEGACSDDETLTARFKKYEFLPYASRHWAEHLRGAPEMSLRPLVMAFLKDERLLSSAVQAKETKQSRFTYVGYSQNFSKGIKTLGAAALFGLKNVTEVLINGGFSVEEKDDKERTPLILAAKEGHDGIVKLLLDHSEADAKATDEDGWTALHSAVTGGHDKVVDVLLESISKIDINARDSSGFTALHQAAMQGNKEMVEKLLNKQADPKIKDNHGWTPLDSAVPAGYESIVQLLLAHGADVNSRDEEGWTALHWAAPQNHIGTVQLLLQNNADVNVQSHEGRTALHCCAQDGSETIMEMLLRKGADPNIPDENGCTALHGAAAKGRERMVRLLLQYGANPKAEDKDEWTPLHAAAVREQEAVVQVLLDLVDNGRQVVDSIYLDLSDIRQRVALEELAEEKEIYSGPLSGVREAAAEKRVDRMQTLLGRGVDINEMSDRGWTALSVAASDGNEKMVRLLLDNGAHVNAVGIRKLTPLHWAAQNGNKEVVQMLLERGADIDAKDEGGRTALYMAAVQGYNAAMRLLLKHGADVNAKTKKSRTPLINATYKGEATTVRLLLEAEADTEIRDSEGLTALLLAAEGGHDAVVSLLLDHKADIEAKGPDGSTALLRATREGYYTIVKRLLKHGANIEAQDNNGLTALMIAMQQKDERIERLLIEKGADPPPDYYGFMKLFECCGEATPNQSQCHYPDVFSEEIQASLRD
ncbi:hypothetical protein VTN96DRAFT_7704 [Rasamsonia emersonii]